MGALKRLTARSTSRFLNLCGTQRIVSLSISTREVWIEEEKGSDVNLASQFLSDGFRARYDVAFVVSNDGDLKMPVEIGRDEFKASIIVINPHDGRRSQALTPNGTDLNRFYRRVRPGGLRASQLPLELEDEHGKIRCPQGWSKPQK